MLNKTYQTHDTQGINALPNIFLILEFKFGEEEKNMKSNEICLDSRKNKESY